MQEPKDMDQSMLPPRHIIRELDEMWISNHHPYGIALQVKVQPTTPWFQPHQIWWSFKMTWASKITVGWWYLSRDPPSKDLSQQNKPLCYSHEKVSEAGLRSPTDLTAEFSQWVMCSAATLLAESRFPACTGAYWTFANRLSIFHWLLDCHSQVQGHPTCGSLLSVMVCTSGFPPHCDFFVPKVCKGFPWGVMRWFSAFRV